jgi:hypothetical protein
MKEEININGKKVWILIEPHAVHDHEEGEQAEYFTASYTFDELADGPGVVLFLEEGTMPKHFESPVQALEFANEKLLGVI